MDCHLVITVPADDTEAVSARTYEVVAYAAAENAWEERPGARVFCRVVRLDEDGEEREDVMPEWEIVPRSSEA